jgi:endoglucanase
MGEFGAYGKADMQSRVSWTTFMREEAEKRGISWSYWEFGAGFGVYDRGAGAWNEELLWALIPDG